MSGSVPTVAPDALRAASHRNTIEHLTSPFASGAVDTVLFVDASGLAAQSVASREPLAVIALVEPLGVDRIRVVATADPGGVAPLALPAIDFAPWTEAGGFVALYRPPIDSGTQLAAPFTLGLAVERITPDESRTPVPVGEVSAMVEVRLIEGIMGRLLFAMTDEKKRIRRCAREIAAMRQVETARDDALDRVGAGVAVPRFADDIGFDGVEIVTTLRREPDDEYRRRLGLFTRHLRATKGRVEGLLSGPDPSSAVNDGPLGDLGFSERFEVLEKDNEFAVAIHLVACHDSQHRTDFLNFARAVHLIDPRDTADADQVHEARYLPTATKASVSQLRHRLRGAFDLEGSVVLAPMLAAAFDRLGRCRRALGDGGRWRISDRTPDDGSRYELALGADVRIPSVTKLAALADAASDVDRPDSGDAEVEALLRNMRPRPPSVDRLARWLLEPCGFRTVHRRNSQRVFVSHLPAFGLTVDGPSVVAENASADLVARYHAEGDPGHNVVLVEGQRAALAAWVGAGRAAWTSLDEVAARAAWATVTAPPPPGSADLLRAAGLPVIETPGPFVEQLLRLPEELVDTIQLDAARAARILAGEPPEIDELTTLVGLLRAETIASVVPLVTPSGDVLLILGAVGLPRVGTNLTGQRSTGFRWYVVPIEGPGGTIGPIGSRSTFVPAGPGLSAIVVIGYVRRGDSDPYEFRVELPPGTTLDLKQYEYLMNLLDHAHPVGVEVNTFRIRGQHVDLDGDGVADPLSPAAAKTFRRFRRPRHRGETSVTLGT